MALTTTEIVDYLQTYLSPDKRRNRCGKYKFLDLVPTITCADGTTMSVQASRTHYCSPRNNKGPWNEVEVGFPSRKIKRLMQYAETPSSPRDTVYGWVPIETVAEAILEHGGIRGEQ